MPLSLWPEEDGVYVDRILLTTDAAFTPEGDGPAESASVAVTAAEREQPTGQLRLDPIYPNPLSEQGHLVFHLPAPATARLEVFDAIGRRIEVLVDENLPAGTHERVVAMSGLPAGIYFLRLWASGAQAMTKLTVLR